MPGSGVRGWSRGGEGSRVEPRAGEEDREAGLVRRGERGWRGQGREGGNGGQFGVGEREEERRLFLGEGD